MDSKVRYFILLCTMFNNNMNVTNIRDLIKRSNTISIQIERNNL